MATPSQDRIAFAGDHPAAVETNWHPAIWFGLFLMIIGGALLCVGPPTLDTYATVTPNAFFLTLIGVLLYLLGFEVIRILIYPLVLMLLMIPMPGFILQNITVPLQMIASKLADRLLEFLGFSVLRDGNILILPGQTLNVAEACSGLRSLRGLTFLGQAYIYLCGSQPWMRGVIALAIIPIGVFANSVRVAATAIAGSRNREWAQGLFHESTGCGVFVVAFPLHLADHSLLKRLWPDRGVT